MKKISLFSFVVKRLSFLKAIPFLPHVFDAWLRLWLVLTSSKIPGYIDYLEANVSTWPNVVVGLHKYGGLQFNYHGKEIAHIHSNGLVDIRFSRAMKNILHEEGRITNHHVFENSGWVSFFICNESDKSYAENLMKLAYDNLRGPAFTYTGS